MTGKYPASIIDTVAAAIALAMDDTHLFVDDPRYPGKGLGAPHSEEYIEEVRAGAVAALDALGLTVTEEWGQREPGGAVIPAAREEQARHWAERTTGPVVCHTVLHAETDWEVVSDGQPR